jgi:glyoxylase-like metal-dependent hydrolase (beta-lactamase superfamily II)
MRLRALSLVSAAFATAAFAQQNQPANVHLQVLPVQGSVYMIAGAGGNIAVQVGQEGVLVVDTGLAGTSDAVLEEIRKLSDKPLEYILNTHFHPDHTGGNEALRKAGVTITGANVTGNLTDAAVGAQIVAQLNVLNRMSAPTGRQAPTPTGAWPTDTEFIRDHKDLFFNDEPVQMIHQPAAHTDGDSVVWFRRSDVLVTGDIFVTTSYPFIDIEHGGSIQGEIDALNNIIDITVPKHEEEGGTYVISGHGRVCDEWEVVEYRDMVTIIRDRVQAAIKDGKTLAQIKEDHLTRDYDARYDTKTGFGGANQFIEAVYKSLIAGK